MRARSLLAATLFAAAVSFSAQSARAGDTIRLNIPSKDTPTLNLAGIAADAAADTIDVRGYRGGFSGGSRGGYGVYRGGYYGGYRGGYGVYRGGYYGGYRGYYGGYGYGGYYYGGYYPSYYYSAPVIVTPPVYYPQPVYYPIRTSVVTGVPTVSLSIGSAPPPAGTLNVNPYAQPLPQGQPLPGDQTYPYDGGPRQPVPTPMPKPEESAVPAPTGSPVPPRLPLEGRTVSLPAQPKYAYPAYGDAPRDTTPDRTTVVRLPR